MAVGKHSPARIVILILLLAVAALAADITGDWKGDLQTPRGIVQVSYTFKQEGETLTGTWQTANTPVLQISEGKVKGDQITFVVLFDQNANITLAHEGTLKNDEIQFTMKPSGEFPGSTVVARRVKQ
jgi:hypothetical protein